MELKDFLILPFYLMLFYFIAYKVRNHFYKDTTIKVYFLPALTLKVLGAFALALVYSYYYSGPGYRNDTFGIFNESQIIIDALWHSPKLGWQILLSHAGDVNMETYQYIKDFDFYYYRESDTFFLIKLITILSFFSFNSYYVIALIFAFFSFSGMWMLFRSFEDMYPRLHRGLAIAILGIPSVIFWGSGLLKDPLVIGSMGWLFWGIYRIGIKGNKRPVSFIIVLLSSLLIILLKPYIFLIYFPALVFWVFLVYKSKIQPGMIRQLLTPAIIILISLFIIFLPKYSGREFNQYSVDKILITIHDHQNWNAREGQGSAYTLGEVPDNLWGLIKKFPAAMNVALFRPYLWEVKNPMMAASAIESLVLLLFTVFVFIRTRVWNGLKIIFNNPLVFCCLAFALILALGIGISSYNFGALSRYRIPSLPFYLSALFIILYEGGVKKVMKGDEMRENEIN